MKHVKGILAALIGCCLFLCSPVPVCAKDYSKAKYDGTRWDQIREDYRDTETDRLIFVKCTGGTKATVEMWEKVSVTGKLFADTAKETMSAEACSTSETINEWEKIVSCRAYTGMNGLGKKREGDRKTPVGIFNISMAFGRKKSPGTAGNPTRS